MRAGELAALPAACGAGGGPPGRFRDGCIHRRGLAAGSGQRCGDRGMTVDLYGADTAAAVREAAMAAKATVALEDDLDGGPADETVRFAIGGAECEIGLNKKNARAVPLAIRAVRPGMPVRPGQGSDAGRRGLHQAVSAAAASGPGQKTRAIAVSARGRIPASVAEQYQAAAQ